jgi:hypothetical protein
VVDIWQKFEQRFRWLAQRGKFNVDVGGGGVGVEGVDVIVDITSESY